MGEWKADGGSLFDPAVLRRLLEQLERTDVDELEVVHGSSRLYLRRDPETRGVLLQRLHGSGGGTKTEGVSVPAPLAGVYYSRPTPDDPAFVTAGAVVERGQVVALIEAMKVFNEVVSEIRGEVLSLAVADGDLVEAGQALIYLAPRDEEVS